MAEFARVAFSEDKIEALFAAFRRAAETHAPPEYMFVHPATYRWMRARRAGQIASRNRAERKRRNRRSRRRP